MRALLLRRQLLAVLAWLGPRGAAGALLGFAAAAAAAGRCCPSALHRGSRGRQAGINVAVDVKARHRLTADGAAHETSGRVWWLLRLALLLLLLGLCPCLLLRAVAAGAAPSRSARPHRSWRRLAPTGALGRRRRREAVVGGCRAAFFPVLVLHRHTVAARLLHGNQGGAGNMGVGM